MSVSGVGGGMPPVTGSSDKRGEITDGVTDFMSYMKESPAQRMQDAWLAQHGITKEQFNAMSPADKKKLMDEMKQDIEQKLKQQAETGSAAAKKIFGQG